MTRDPVESSRISALGYDLATRVLEVEFKPTRDGVSRRVGFMTAVEIATIVYRREMAGAATDSSSIARWLGTDEWAVRSALIIARKCGLLVRRYRADAPFGERDTYITTHNGRQAAKEMANR